VAKAFTNDTLRAGSRGPAVQAMQRALVDRGHVLAVDGIFGPETTRAVGDFQRACGLKADGVVGPDTKAALQAPAAPVARDRVETTVRGSGVRAPTPAELAQRPSGTVRAGSLQPPTTRGVPSGRASSSTSSVATGVAQRSVTVDGHVFQVHDRTRAELGNRSVPGRRFIALDANSVSGREEILRPLIVIPNNATSVERAAARVAVDRVARWLDDHAPGQRRATGVVVTTAQNGRGIRGFFHTEFFSVNDSAAVKLVKERTDEFARILGETLGRIPGANFIVPHGAQRGRFRDVGAVSADGQTTELGLGQTIVREGFGRL
jgi:hypothetical protein